MLAAVPTGSLLFPGDSGLSPQRTAPSHRPAPRGTLLSRCSADTVEPGTGSSSPWGWRPGGFLRGNRHPRRAWRWPRAEAGRGWDVEGTGLPSRWPLSGDWSRWARAPAPGMVSLKRRLPGACGFRARRGPHGADGPDSSGSVCSVFIKSTKSSHVSRAKPAGARKARAPQARSRPPRLTGGRRGSPWPGSVPVPSRSDRRGGAQEAEKQRTPQPRTWLQWGRVGPCV